MGGLAVLILLGIAGYFGYVKGLHMWQTYLAQRLAILKEAEADALKAIVDKGYASVTGSAVKMNDAEFQQYLDRNFIPWGRMKGIIR